MTAATRVDEQWRATVAARARAALQADAGGLSAVTLRGIVRDLVELVDDDDGGDR